MNLNMLKPRFYQLAMLGMLVASPTTVVYAQESVAVTVPGNATGAFGNEVSLVVPLAPAITISGPGTIQVVYVSGTVHAGGGLDVGPNGTPYTAPNDQYPLQEAQGVRGGTITNLGALFGVFVPKDRVEDPRGFKALDGTKNMTRIGIKPHLIRFIGEGLTFHVRGAGTLFLGINDNIADDNGGSFTVQVTSALE